MIRVGNGEVLRDQIKRPRHFFFSIPVNNITVKITEPFLSAGTERPCELILEPIS